MAYLIDGNNFLGRTAPSGLRDDRRRYELVFKLLAFQKAKRIRILLVFDGAPDDFLCGLQSRAKKFSIHFAAPGMKGDDVVKELILRQKEMRRFTVVTSDRELRDFARARGAKTLSSKEFASELRKALRERKIAQELEKKPQTLSPFELKLWLDTFGSQNG